MRRRTFLKAAAAFLLPWTRLLDPTVREPELPWYSGSWHSGVGTVPVELTADMLNRALSRHFRAAPILGITSQATLDGYRVLLESQEHSDG